MKTTNTPIVKMCKAKNAVEYRTMGSDVEFENLRCGQPASHKGRHKAVLTVEWGNED